MTENAQFIVFNKKYSTLFVLPQIVHPLHTATCIQTLENSMEELVGIYPHTITKFTKFKQTPYTASIAGQAGKVTQVKGNDRAVITSANR